MNLHRLSEPRPGKAKTGWDPIQPAAGARARIDSRMSTPRSAWRVAPKPLLEIRSVDDVGPASFGHIWGVARTARGEIVVSDEPAQELRMFDADGRHLRTFGRKGQGPGEFVQIRGVVVHGDTVYALDNRNGTALFTLDGKLIRQRPYPLLGEYHAVDPWGVLADGSVIEGATGHVSREELERSGGRIEMRGLFRIASDHRTAAQLTTVPTFEFFRGEADRPGGTSVAFAPTASVAVGNNRVCFGRGSRYEITCLSANGNVQLIIRRDVAAVPVSKSAREAYLRRVRTPVAIPGHATPTKAQLEAIAERTHFAESFPLLSWMLGGANDEIWVSDYVPHLRTLPFGEPPARSDSIHWNVFDRLGSWVGRIVLPARFRPHQVGMDFILGISRDDDGVEGITMYRLFRT